MEYKNEHITYVYLCFNKKANLLYTMTYENTPYDVTEACPNLVIVGCRIIHWGGGTEWTK
jgi:hypothetical protein